MIRISAGVSRCVVAIGAAALSAFVIGCSHHDNSAPSNSVMNSSGPEINLSETSRDLEPPSKLAPALQRLASASESSRDLSPSDGSPEDLPASDEIGYPAPGTKDVFEVAIHITPEADVKAITAAGATIQMRLGNILYGSVHARDLAQVSDVDGVTLVAPMPGSSFPKPPKVSLETAPHEAARDIDAAGGNGEAAKFEHQGQTGKGVIVGIVDTGIDWRHEDFQNPDGTSRILYLWDIYDNTWEDSKHTVGSAPPMKWDDTGKPMGTIYTNEQITAALKGKIKIKRTDAMGHGTACAGTAAGNGLGVAPEADLVIVDTYIDDEKNPDNDGSCGVQGAAWIKDIAAQRHEPCVISLSFGSHLTPHDGTGEQESGFNEVVNGGEAPGVVICASAGNEGQDSMHARGRFGPGRPNELNNGFGEPVQLFITKETILAALFDSRDDFKLRILGLDKFLYGTDKKPARIDFFKGKKTGGGDGLQITGSNNLSEADQNAIKSLRNDKKIGFTSLPNGTDAVIVDLPPGSYYVAATGNSEKVTHGVYDLYLPDVSAASFGSGGDHRMIIGAPGDADDIITVGSYDFRNQWDNQDGTTTHCGRVDLGNISDYSSEGFRRDGAIKPDIAAPGQFTISAMSAGCMLADDMGGSVAITKDGKHVAWAGTSASCPYAAGVIALMLEKNPTLTANQVKQILRDTADHDMAVTGAVPNGEWGYGKLNPEKAMAKVTPAPPLAAAPPATEPSPVAPSPVAGPAPSVTPVKKSSFAGTFKGDDLVVVLILNADGTYSGTMVRNGQTFTIAAHVVADQLEGNVSSQGKDFPFTATIDGDAFTLHAGSKSFSLTRQDAPRGMGEDWLKRSVAEEKDDAGASRDVDSGLAFKPAEIDDPMINNWPAYKLLVPVGWSFQGAIHWNQDPYSMVSPEILAHAPGGFPGILLYPQGDYVTGIREQRLQMVQGIEGGDQWINQQFAEGQLYMGREIRRAVHAADYVKYFVIPLYRKDLAEAQMAGVTDAPSYGKLISTSMGLQNLPGSTVEAVKIRFQYDFKGRPIDEDIYCAVTVTPSIPGLYMWTGNVISFTAPRGTIDQCMPELTTIVTSARPQLPWVNACMQVSQMMQQNIANAIAQEGALSRYIANISDQISDMTRQSYEERCRVEDKVSQEWHEYIMGVGTYQGPNGPIELPNNGNPWYTDPQGGYHQAPAGGPPPDSGWTPMKPFQG